jgi:hypothetical protein
MTLVILLRKATFADVAPLSGQELAIHDPDALYVLILAALLENSCRFARPA